jgi:hypothetical protein
MPAATTKLRLAAPHGNSLERQTLTVRIWWNNQFCKGPAAAYHDMSKQCWK